MTDGEKHIIASGKYCWTRRVLRIVKDPVGEQPTVEELRRILGECLNLSPHFAVLMGTMVVQKIVTKLGYDYKVRSEVSASPEFQALHKKYSKYLSV